jgi:hypothetical protein
MLAAHARHISNHQDVSQQLRTYHGFLLGLRYVVMHFIVIASFLILAFCTGAGFWGGAAAALVALLIGLYFARDRKRVTWASEFGALFISTSAESGHEIEDMVIEDGGSIPASEPNPAQVGRDMPSSQIMTSRG